MAAAEQLITENLDIWVSAVQANSAAGRGKAKKLELYGIKKLRELILGTALAGGFSTDVGTFDKPAAELLKAAREDYSKSTGRKLKDYKQGDALIAEFDLPPNWPWARVGDLCDLQTGATPSRQKPEYFGGDIRWLVSGDINQGEIDDCEGRITEQGLESSNCKVLPAGTVLIALNGQGKTRASVAHLNVEATCNQSLVGMIPFDRNLVDTRFLLLALRYRYYEIREITGQKQRRGLNMGLVAQLSVPLPPIDIQARIVAKLDELMALCDQLEHQQETSITAHQTLVQTLLDALTNASERGGFTTAWERIADHFDTLFTTEWSIDQLKQAILQLAVMGKLAPQDPNDEPASELLKWAAAEKALLVKDGKIKKSKTLPTNEENQKPFELPGGWEWSRLPDIGELARGKSKHRPRNDPALYSNGSVPLVQTGDVSRAEGTIETYTARYNEMGVAQSRLWPKGTMCITIAANIADTAVLGFEACFPDSVVGFTPFNSSMNVRYFDYFIRTAKNHLEEYAPSTAQKNINLSILGNLLVPLPPLGELNRIVAKVDELMALCDNLKIQLKKAQITQLQFADSTTARVSY